MEALRFPEIDIRRLLVYSLLVSPRRKRAVGYSESSPESERLCAVLKAALLAAGLNRRKVERAMGLSDSYLSRLFSGAIALRVTHVVEIARVLEVEPAEIFAAAFHGETAHTAAYERVREALQPFRWNDAPSGEGAASRGGPPDAAAEEPAGPEVEQALEKLLLKALRRIVDRAEGRALTS